MADIDLWPVVGAVLDANLYLVLATADAEGTPWATPVFFGSVGEDRIYWVSSPDSRHSRNLAARSTVALTAFDTHGTIGVGDAIYLTATAGPVDGAAARDGLQVLNARLPEARHLGEGDLAPGGPLVVYRAVVSAHDVLLRGNDARFDNEVDTRMRVTRPGA